MDLIEANRLLTIIQNIDKRIVDEAVVVVWQELLKDLRFADCFIAVTQHFRESTDYLMPAHIVAGARALERERLRAANNRRAIESAHPTDQRPLTDRRAEVRELVDAIRGVLPEGDPDKLSFSRGHWRRVRANRERLANAQPNPHYDPKAHAQLAQWDRDMNPGQDG
jgi:hypothetical protein